MTDKPIYRRTLVLFCKVVDNFGDIGICWRLARQLHAEHDIVVTLWVDDLVSFQRLCPNVVAGITSQEVAGVTIRLWRADVVDDRDTSEVTEVTEVTKVTNAADVMDGAADDDVTKIADIVIEFFGCDIPPHYLSAMATRTPPPVWLNLEGLSAEEWVEGCHTLPSPHGQYSLTKYFYFPGFTPRTGGLICESSLIAQRTAFQNDPLAGQRFLLDLGLSLPEITSFKVSLFCYPHAPVSSLFDVWQAGQVTTTCVVPEGVAVDAIRAFFGTSAVAGAVLRRGALTVRILPFLPQPQYDQLLWACDFNFVRGEDSFVRAQWANRPFVWHIYPQDKNLHHVKLNAFLKNYAAELASLAALSRCWNGIELADPLEPIDWSVFWTRCIAELPAIAERGTQWQQQLQQNGDLASNLLHFAASLQAVGKQ